MDHNVTIGAKVKAFRTAKKYTLKQLSEESGLSCYDSRSQSVFVL